ncbi:MAG: hypothetical protein ACTTHG_06515 [Treponemataceae bacterium]
MKNKIFGVLAILVVLIAVVGCTTFTAGGFSYGSVGQQNLGTFEKRVTVWKFLGTPGGATLFNISQDATDSKISGVIADEIARLGGTGAINVSIEQKASFGDMLIGSITGTILAPCHVTVKGTVVK